MLMSETRSRPCTSRRSRRSAISSRRGSFNKAAQLNFVSQSAVSQQLKSLETRYGRPLLERGSRRGLTLTEAGRLFYAECRELLDRFRQLEERLREPAGRDRGNREARDRLQHRPARTAAVRHAVHEGASAREGARRVQPHRQGLRGLSAGHDRLRHRGVPAAPLEPGGDSLARGEAGARLRPTPQARAPAHGSSWRSSRASRSSRSSGTFPTRKTIDRILRAHRVAVDTVMEFDNVETIKRSVEVGSGLSILPETTVVNETAERAAGHGRLRRRPVHAGRRRDPPPRTGAERRGARVRPHAGGPSARRATSEWNAE